ncbi:hypothetical protein GCM10011352_31870 [Marinobacterium zhoushanense]|uniref:Uncharacterized protein n=2 Tax=Marinobacterium zhoushanense TaxID=1679163 RepID=A0ABQ1KP11_9GAMM|nr:hypothetical protein GCM10011352_31870 [Marinobacterium zhoushanense]
MGSVFILILCQQIYSGWDFYKNRASNFIEISDDKISVNFKGDSELIYLSSVTNMVLYDLFGDRILHIVCGKESHKLTINGYDGDISNGVIQVMGVNNIRKAGFFEAIKLFFK